MKLHYIFILIGIGLLSYQTTNAQENSSGKCYSVDYLLWNDNQVDLYGDCGNSDVFNPGNQLTMEVWVRAYTFGENRKVMGKKTLENLNYNGYVLGFENLHVYSEISNPDNLEVPREGNGPMPVDSAWIHIATTYNSNGMMKNYINGQYIDGVQVFPPNPIAESTGNFIIGKAPWGYSYLFYGDLDEVRVWNVERTEEELQNNMFNHLNGDENGLIAYYNFNQTEGATFFDQGPNQNNGTISEPNHVSFEWADSYAPIGDDNMRSMTNIRAAWCGKKQTAGFNLIDTLNGLSFIANIQEKEFKKYLVAGHNNLSGTTQENIPTEAPLDFKRLNKSWYVNQAGDFTTTLVFDLKEAAAENDTLEINKPDSLYTLLKMDEAGVYQPVYSANMVYFGDQAYNLVFENVNLSDGFYTVGVGSERLAWASSVKEIKKNKNISIYPNPANDFLNIKGAINSSVDIIDISGKTQLSIPIETDNEVLNTSSLNEGVYFVRIKSKNQTITKKLIIK